MLSRRARVATVLITGLATGGVVAPLAGLVVGAIVAMALWRPGGRAMLSLGASAAIGISALYVLELQFRYRFPTKLDWPQHFAKVVGLTWVGVALFVADAAVEWLTTRPGAAPGEAVTPPRPQPRR
jgi:MFS family permease